MRFYVEPAYDLQHAYPTAAWLLALADDIVFYGAFEAGVTVARGPRERDPDSSAIQQQIFSRLIREGYYKVVVRKEWYDECLRPELIAEVRAKSREDPTKRPTVLYPDETDPSAYWTKLDDEMLEKSVMVSYDPEALFPHVRVPEEAEPPTLFLLPSSFNQTGDRFVQGCHDGPDRKLKDLLQAVEHNLDKHKVDSDSGPAVRQGWHAREQRVRDFVNDLVAMAASNADLAFMSSKLVESFNITQHVVDERSDNQAGQSTQGKHLEEGELDELISRFAEADKVLRRLPERVSSMADVDKVLKARIECPVLKLRECMDRYMSSGAPVTVDESALMRVMKDAKIVTQQRRQDWLAGATAVQGLVATYGVLGGLTAPISLPVGIAAGLLLLGLNELSKPDQWRQEQARIRIRGTLFR